MPTSGDVVDLELGAPEGREAGFRHPAVVVTAQRILDAAPSVECSCCCGGRPPQTESTMVDVIDVQMGSVLWKPAPDAELVAEYDRLDVPTIGVVRL